MAVAVSIAQTPDCSDTTYLWDVSLPSLILSNVSLQADSLEVAWQKISNTYFIRSIMYMYLTTNSADYSESFVFHRSACTVQELLDAFTTTYSHYRWTQDNKTGIIWIYPKVVDYADLLNQQVEVRTDQCGVPLVTCLIPTLSKVIDHLYLAIVVRGAAMEQTFDYGVDIPKGTYLLRDILNTCCLAHLSTSFGIVRDFRRGRDSLYVSPDNFAISDALLPGALHFWELEIGSLNGKTPMEDDVINALNHPDQHVRWAATQYMEAELWHYKLKRRLKQITLPECTIGPAIGELTWFGRANLAMYPEAMREDLQKWCTPEFLSHGDPHLAVLGALWIVRLGGDQDALDIVTKRRFSEGDLSEIKSQMHWLIRKTPLLKAYLLKKNPQWAGFSSDEIQKIGAGDVFYPLKGSPIKGSNEKGIGP